MKVQKDGFHRGDCLWVIPSHNVAEHNGTYWRDIIFMSLFRFLWKVECGKILFYYNMKIKGHGYSFREFFQCVSLLLSRL